MVGRPAITTSYCSHSSRRIRSLAGFGAVSAIEGALEVSQCLKAAATAASSKSSEEEGGGKLSPEEIAAALRRYESARIQRATAVQLQSFTQGSGSYHSGSSDGSSIPESAAAALTPTTPPPADSAKEQQPRAVADPATNATDFQTWLQSYRSPWTE